jgi:hypothetical protein
VKRAEQSFLSEKSIDSLARIDARGLSHSAKDAMAEETILRSKMKRET